MLTVVPRSRTTAEIDTFINEVSTTRTWAWDLLYGVSHCCWRWRRRIRSMFRWEGLRKGSEDPREGSMRKILVLVLSMFVIASLYGTASAWTLRVRHDPGNRGSRRHPQGE